MGIFFEKIKFTQFLCHVKPWGPSYTIFAPALGFTSRALCSNKEHPLGLDPTQNVAPTQPILNLHPK
jgi:hypothetical protein